MGGVTVLVVDDDAAIRVSLGDVLTCEGYEVLYAENGLQAMNLLRSAHPHLMVLDLMMPVMSGWEVLEEIQSNAELASMPVIVISAMCAPGVSACIQKPIDLGHLLSVVGELSGGGPRGRAAHTTRHTPRSD